MQSPEGPQPRSAKLTMPLGGLGRGAGSSERGEPDHINGRF